MNSKIIESLADRLHNLEERMAFYEQGNQALNESFNKLDAQLRDITRVLTGEVYQGLEKHERDLIGPEALWKKVLEALDIMDERIKGTIFPKKES